MKKDLELSSYALDAIKKQELINQQRPFWEKVWDLITGKKYKLLPSTTKDKDFIHFATLHKIEIYIKTDNENKTHYIHLSYKDKPIVELLKPTNIKEEYSENFAQYLIASLYLVCINDDLKISNEEDRILSGIITYLNPSKKTLKNAKRIVYSHLLSIFLKDQKIEEKEKEILNKIRNTLCIDVKTSDIEEQQFRKLLNDIKQKTSITKEDILNIYTTANALGIGNRLSLFTEEIFLKIVRDIKNKKEISIEDIKTVADYGKRLGIDKFIMQPYIEELEEKLFNQEIEKGNLPIIEEVPVFLKKGEKAHFFSSVIVLQQKTERRVRRGYIGTRVKIGKMPIYLGTSSPYVSEKEVIKVVGEGDFIITNKRIILSGTKINYKIPLGKILDINLYSDGIQIIDETRYGGRYYKINKPQRAEKIIKKLIEDLE